jgi:tetratricopeptide (TPR) repeat protein
MVCVKCGKRTKSGVYVCQVCVSEAKAQQHFAESLVAYPSILNNLNYGDSGLLSVDEENVKEIPSILGDDLSLQTIPIAINHDTGEFTEERVKKLNKNFLKVLTNCGLPLDLEEKPLALLTKGDLTLAQYVLLGAQKIENKFPNHSDENLHLILGNLHYCLSHVSSGAITIIEKEFHLKSALEYYDKVLSVNQKSVQAWKNKARVMLDLGENQEAVSCLNWITENLELPEGDLTVLLNKGWALFKLEKFDEALKCFDSVLDKVPSNVEAWRRKGDVFAKTNRWGGAIQCYNEAVKHAPRREDIWIAMSETYIGHEKFKDASRSLDEVLKINIWSSDAWYLQGIVFSKIVRWGAAVQCLDKSININPFHIKAWKAKGDLLLDTNRYEEAMNCYEKALKIQPENPKLLLSKARVQKSMGRFDEALEILKYVQKIKKENPDVLFEIGDILQETGKAYKALKSFDLALELRPNFIMAFFKKGQTLEKLRRFKEALSCYEEVLKLDPNFQMAQRAMKDIISKMSEE